MVFVQMTVSGAVLILLIVLLRGIALKRLPKSIFPCEVTAEMRKQCERILRGDATLADYLKHLSKTAERV